MYFNNTEDYLSAATSTTTCLLGLGSDCGVLFVQSSTLNESSAVTATQKETCRCAQAGQPTAVATSADVGTWWLRRV